MELSYKGVRDEIEKVMLGDLLEKDRLITLHRQIEVHNAHKIIAGEDERQMKDIEFLLRSAIFLFDLGKPGDWKLQLEAALGILDRCPDA